MHRLPLLAVLAVLAFELPVFAAGDARGDLAGGGRLRGDISTATGETDRITIDLTRGSTVTIVIRAGFIAHLALSDPTGAPVALAGASDGHAITLRDVPVATSGQWTLAISAVDQTQGLYSLQVVPHWPKQLVVTGSGRQELLVDMPARARLSAVVRSDGGIPEIAALYDPAGASLLAASITGAHKTAVLPPVTTTSAGSYRMTIGTADGESAWTARFLRTVPRAPLAQASIRNGIDTVSFAEDGVGRIFANRCSGCHGWAASYGGVRSSIPRAFPRIVSGIMPPSGRLPVGEISLIKAWLATGKTP